MKDLNCDKIYSCDTPGCQRKFPGEYLLSMHKKRHDMINLTINNGYSDQTPTPTRFIRNCEEVGLFQDLQNVNPFEETFRKAVEEGQNAISVNQNIVDDTLHTPNVFPLIHDVQTSVQEIKAAPTVKEPSKPILPEQPRKKRKYKRKKVKTEIRLPSAVVTTIMPNMNVSLKLPIPKLSSNVNVFSQPRFSITTRSVRKCPIKSPERIKTQPETKKSELQEYNRQAQKRARRKRQNYLGELEAANKLLNEQLSAVEKRLKCAMDENTMLRTKLKLFEEKTAIGYDMSTQTPTNATVDISDKRPSVGFQDHNYILPPENRDKMDSSMLKRPFKKRKLHPKLFLKL